jgi:hypothetical protein
VSRKYISAIGQIEGDDVNQAIDSQLDELKEKIEDGGYIGRAAETPLWRGADVMISPEMTEEIRNWLGNQPLVIGFQQLPAGRRALITPHARELSWLFRQLRRVFIDKLDYVSKYDFFGGLAVRAHNCIQEQGGDPDCDILLKAVLEWSRGFEPQ